jgi:N-acetylglutamate synthase-like GNAT family acetyltransferase
MLRDATISDLEKLQELHNRVQLDITKLGDPEYESLVQKKGFLLGTDEAHDMSEELEKAYKFSIAEEDEKILGYLIADHRHEQKFYDDEYKTWFNTELKDFYYSNPKGMTIATVVVDPDHAGEGIASSMLNELETQLKTDNIEYLFSIVVLAPVTNCPSIVWHTKSGFRRLAMGRPRRLFELDNFSSVLLYKKI